MRRIDWQDLDEKAKGLILARPRSASSQRESVQAIIDAVKTRGDEALRAFTLSFDGCVLESLRVAEKDLKKAAENADPGLFDALACAAGNIEMFHRPQLRTSYTVEAQDGLKLSREVRPLARIGLYIPAGTAPLISTLLMLIIPARLAGCDDIVLCTPPGRDGLIHPALLAAAYRFGIRKVYSVGGAQAIAAMAYGSESIPKVDKIFGPGNSWVTEAKMLVSQDPEGAAIDMPAGPSELMVVGDAQSHPRFIASDLLSQAEHGRDSQVILVSTDSQLIDRVADEIKALVPGLPRADVIREALAYSSAIWVRDTSEVLEIIDRYAPEHLSLQLENPEALIPSIRKAGSIFCGPWTPESAGDYASGTNHVLPTGGWARSLSGLTVESFQRTMSVQTLKAEALTRLGRTIQTLASVEGLGAHGLAVKVRLDSLAAAKRGTEVGIPC